MYLASWLVWLSWLERQPVNRKAAGAIPSQGTCLGCGSGSQSGCVQEETDISLSHGCFSFSRSFPLSLKSISMPSGEDYIYVNWAYNFMYEIYTLG